VIPQSGTATISRIPVDIRRFPWISPLVADYAFAYDKIADFFAGDPRRPEAWLDAIARTRARPRSYDTIADIVRAQQRRRGAPAEAAAAGDRLRDPETVAVVTGQQAGLFGGPLFTLLKALTAIELARTLRTRHGVSAVAIFWIDAEDHDWDEVKSCGVLDASLTRRTIAIGNPPGAQVEPVARVRLDESIEAAIAELAAALPPTEFTASTLTQLRAAYRPDRGMAEAFGRWMETLLGARGLIVYDASDPAAKPLAADIFRREVEHAGETARLAAQAGAAMTSRGYSAQVSPLPETLALFHLNGGRQPIRLHDGGFLVGDRAQARHELLERVEQSPHQFSPNVLLRPLVQDSLFPTVCYVAGPNELAYLGQLKNVYRAFEVPMPLMFQRGTATLLDSNAARFLVRHDVQLEDLQAQDEALLNRLLESQLPPGVDAALQAISTELQERMDRLTAGIVQIDPTLEGAARSALGRMHDDVKKLHGKIIQAVKRKDDTLRRQFHHVRAQAFPDGHPQERTIGFVHFVNKYGPTLIDRLLDEIPAELGIHWVFTP